MKLKLLVFVLAICIIWPFALNTANAQQSCLETVSSDNVTLVTTGWETEEISLEMMDRLYQLEKLYIRGTGPSFYPKQPYLNLPSMVLMVDSMEQVWAINPNVEAHLGGVVFIAQWNGCQLLPHLVNGLDSQSVRLAILIFTPDVRFDDLVFAVLGHEFAHVLGNWEHNIIDGLGGPLAWENSEFGVDILGAAWMDTCFQLPGKKGEVCQQVIDVVINQGQMPDQPLFGSFDLRNLIN